VKNLYKIAAWKSTTITLKKNLSRFLFFVSKIIISTNVYAFNFEKVHKWYYSEIFSTDVNTVIILTEPFRGIIEDKVNNGKFK